MRFDFSRQILTAHYQATSQYRLVNFEELAPEQQAALAVLRRDPAFFGVLVPTRPSGGSIRSVDRRTAGLFRSLAKPSTLTHVLARAHIECVAGLVLDGVLEIEWNGAFVSGAGAHSIFFATAQPPSEGGAIGRLSRAALEHVQQLPLQDPLAIADRLYRFNTRPSSPRWRNRLPDGGAVAGLLGIDGLAAMGGPRLIDADDAGRPTRHGPWWFWEGHRLMDGGRPTYKLYVSCDPGFIREAFRAVVGRVGNSAAAIKVGASVESLMRPDKLIAYFGSLEQLNAAVERLREVLEGMPAHGVPFTAEVGGDGLLSWGLDPPRDHRTQDWPGAESWRAWVAARLGSALAVARRGAAAVPAWQFAVDRLRLDGVDPASWTPTRTLWDDDDADH